MINLDLKENTNLYEKANEFKARFPDRAVLFCKYKIPIGSWKKAQSGQTQEEFNAHTRSSSDFASGFGILLGRDWHCLDIDGCDDLNLVHSILKAAGIPTNYQWLVRSGNGFHIYIRYSTKQFNKFVNKFISLDGKVFKVIEYKEEGFIVLPPSTHYKHIDGSYLKSGKEYQWINDEPTAPPSVIDPKQLIDFLKTLSLKQESDSQQNIQKKKDISTLNLSHEKSSIYKYCKSLIDNRISEIADATEPLRNHTLIKNTALIRTAYNLLTKENIPVYSQEEIFSLLDQAIATNQSDDTEKQYLPAWESAANEVFSLPKELHKEDVKFNFKPIKFKELMNKTFPPMKWVVDGIIPANGISVLAGSPASFKTWITLEVAVSVAQGKELFDVFQTSQCNVLIIDEEMSESRLRERLTQFDCPDDMPIFVCSGQGFILKENFIQEVIRFVKEEDIKLIIFDSLIRIAGIKDENNSVEFANIFNLMKEFLRKDVTLLITHHNRKNNISRIDGNSMRGSSDILAQIDSQISLSRDTNTNIIEVQQNKSRYATELEKFQLEAVWTEEKVKFTYLGKLEVKSKLTTVIPKILDILRNNNKPMCYDDFKQLLENQIGETYLKKALREIKVSGQANVKMQDHKDYFFVK